MTLDSNSIKFKVFSSVTTPYQLLFLYAFSLCSLKKNYMSHNLMFISTQKSKFDSSFQTFIFSLYKISSSLFLGQCIFHPAWCLWLTFLSHLFNLTMGSSRRSAITGFNKPRWGRVLWCFISCKRHWRFGFGPQLKLFNICLSCKNY